MTEDQTDEVLGVFLAAFPEAVPPEPTLLLWRRMLSRFPHEVGQEAALALLETRHPSKHGKFPTVDEFTPMADRIWNDQHVATRSIDHQTATKLLSGPVSEWGEPGSLPALAGKLVQDLCSGKVEPGSADHVRRQGEVEALARSWGSHCCDQGGLLSYRKRVGEHDYSYTGRCTCSRGQASPYTGYPVIDANTARRVG